MCCCNQLPFAMVRAHWWGHSKPLQGILISISCQVLVWKFIWLLILCVFKYVLKWHLFTLSFHPPLPSSLLPLQVLGFSFLTFPGEVFETSVALMSLMTKPDICHTVEKYLSCGEYSPQKNWTKNCTCGEKWQISGILMTSNLLHYYPKYETARKGNLEVNGPFKFHFCIETIRNYSRCLNNHIIPCLSPNKVENSLLQKCSHIASCCFQEYFHTKNILDTKCAQLNIWQLITSTGALYFMEGVGFFWFNGKGWSFLFNRKGGNFSKFPAVVTFDTVPALSASLLLLLVVHQALLW